MAGLGGEDMNEDKHDPHEEQALDMSMMNSDEIMRDKAVEFLRGWIGENIKPEIRAQIKADPDGWSVPYHFGWGMGIRNALRTAGFRESQLGVRNLDNVYVELVELALKEDGEDEAQTVGGPQEGNGFLEDSGGENRGEVEGIPDSGGPAVASIVT